MRWDNGRVNSYETGARGKFAISFADAVPGVPRDLVASSATDRSISIGWSPPARLGRPPLQRFVRLYVYVLETAKRVLMYHQLYVAHGSVGGKAKYLRSHACT